MPTNKKNEKSVCEMCKVNRKDCYMYYYYNYDHPSESGVKNSGDYTICGECIADEFGGKDNFEGEHSFYAEYPE